VKKLTYLLFLFISFVITAQEKTEYFAKISFENHIIKNNEQNICFISFSLPYNQLVFVKEDSHFLSGFSVSFEIFDDNGFVKREYGDFKVTTENYESTNSDSFYGTGYTKIILQNKKYSIKPFLSLNNTNLTLPCNPINLDLSNKLDSLLFMPIAITKVKGGLALLNEGNKIKYEEDNSSLLFLFYNRPESVDIKISQKNLIVYSETIKPQLAGAIKYQFEDNSINLSTDTSFSNYSLFLLNNVNRFIDEGDFKAEININGNSLNYLLKSEWITKPKSLNYPEIVIAALGVILPQDTIYKLNRIKDEDFYSKAKELFFNKFPSKSKFNKQFNEFFTRVDYAEINYRSLKAKLGVESDRGIIYIKYGAPDSINRDYRARDDISEIWNYKGLNKTFIFTDKTGTGDYVLVR
jgi:GWxTD domain-containing protein